MSSTEPGTSPGNSMKPQPGTTANARDALRHNQPTAPVRLAFYGRTNQRGQGARAELAAQLGLCRAVAGGQAVITRTYYDIPQPVTSLPDFTGIDAGGLPRSGGWDELAAAMASRGRDFDAVICTAADRIARRIPVLRAREESARRCGTPLWCAGELAAPGKYRSLLRQLRRSPFTPLARGAQPPHRMIRQRGGRP